MGKRVTYTYSSNVSFVLIGSPVTALGTKRMKQIMALKKDMEDHGWVLRL